MGWVGGLGNGSKEVLVKTEVLTHDNWAELSSAKLPTLYCLF